MTTRGYNTDPDIYFGLPGSLVRLPWPQGGFSAPVEKQISTFISGGGGYQSSTLVGTSRSYNMQWTALHQTTFDRVNQYWLGARGGGPFALVDPSRPNLFMPNQSAATAVTNDTTGWQTGIPTSSSKTQGVLFSNSDASFIHDPMGIRSLRLGSFSLASLDTYCIVIPTPPYYAWPGVPVMTGLPYTATCWCLPVTVNLTVDVQLQWMDVARVVLSTSALGAASYAAGAWTQLTVTGTAPAGAAFVLPRVVVTSASVTSANASLYLDGFQLEQSDTVHDWAPGAGCGAVAMTAWSEDVPFDANFRISPSLQLREVIA